MKLLSLPEMSLYGAILIAAVLLLRAVFLNRLPKRTFSALWGLAILRLLLPFSVASAVSLYALFPLPEPAAPTAVTASPTPEQSPAPIMIPAPITQPSPLSETAPPTVTVTEPTAEPKAGVSPETVLRLIWCSGTGLLLLVFAAVYLRGRREFRTSLPIEDDFIGTWQKDCPLRRKVTVRRSDRISAPLTYGVFRPVILLPDPVGTDEKTLGHILTHELVHIRRFDAVKKPLCALAVCLHWFNPLVWIMFFFFTRDLELACDEGAVRTLGIGGRSDYARTLIGMEARKSGFLPFFSHFAGFAAEERIKAIMKLKKSSVITSVAAALLVIGTAGAFLTSAAAKPEEETALTDREKPTEGTKEFQKEIDALEKERDALLGKDQELAERQSDLEEQIKQTEAALEERQVALEKMREKTGSRLSEEYKALTEERDHLLDELLELDERQSVLKEERESLLAESRELDEQRSALKEEMEQRRAALLAGDRAVAEEITSDSSEWEWWTAEEYEKWIEEQEKEMESLIGTGSGWYDKQGELHEFTRESVNDILTQYRATLEEIKRGVRVSKPDKDGAVLMQSLPGDGDSALEQFLTEDSLKEALKPYLPFGIAVRVDEAGGETKMYYGEKEVRALYDETAGVVIAAHMGLWNYGEDATDLYAVYTDGVLTGVREATEAERERNTAVRRTNTVAWLSEGDEIVTTEKITQAALGSEAYVMTPEEEKARIDGLFAEYERFGLTRDENGKLYFHGKLVRIFMDGVYREYDVLMITRYTYLDEEGEIDVRTLWTPNDNGDGSIDPFGIMIGIEETTELNISDFRPALETSAVTEETISDIIPKAQAGSESGTDPISAIEADSAAQTAFAEGNGAVGTTIPEKLGQYAPFGITYNKSEGNVYFNGKLVGTFVDCSENGIFTYQSQNVGNREAVDVRTVYENGRIVSVREMTEEEKNAGFSEQPADTALLTEAPLRAPIYKISADFGEYGENFFHKGIDFSAEAGTEIYSFADGTVLEAGFDASQGNYLLIDHGNGLQSLYAHCDELYVQAGEPAEKGAVIASVGNSGYATGYFLHFELRKDGTPIDPKPYLNESTEIAALGDPDISELLAGQAAAPTDQKYAANAERVENRLYFHLPHGEEIYSVADGTVVFSRIGSIGLGQTIVVKSADGTCWGYAHLDQTEPLVSLGKKVKAGDVIGYAGETGWVAQTELELFLTEF